MPLIWKEEYKLGVDQIDHKYEAIFKITNHLEHLSNTPKDRLDINDFKRTLESLHNYFIASFEEEETYYHAIAKSHLEDHIHDHNRILEYLSNSQPRYITNNHHEFAMNLTEFVSRWLIHHFEELEY